MADPWKRKEVIGDCVLYQGDCLEVMPVLGKVDRTISDPPYEAVMQNRWGVLSAKDNSSHVRHEKLGFEAIDGVRDEVAKAICGATDGWAILFCMAEGVRAWRDAIERAGARYKRAMVWVKPDAMPPFHLLFPPPHHAETIISCPTLGP